VYKLGIVLPWLSGLLVMGRLTRGEINKKRISAAFDDGARCRGIGRTAFGTAVSLKYIAVNFVLGP
jgi:hypothetical protein